MGKNFIIEHSRLVVCRICGANYTSLESAERSDCNQPCTEPKFQVGDKATVILRIGAGIEDVGKGLAEVQIRSVNTSGHMPTYMVDALNKPSERLFGSDTYFVTFRPVLETDLTRI